MAPRTIRLLDHEPSLGRFLSDEDRVDAQRLTTPVVELRRGPVSVAGTLARCGAFSAFVLDGLLVGQMRLSAHVTVRLYGPGDIVSCVSGPDSSLVTDVSMRASSDVRLALLGAEFLGATRRWPGLAAGFHLRAAEQAERSAVQTAISQLPRVDERLLAMLWLLAEQWGRVTRVGTVLPLALTHDLLGALIGARRSTVTLAIGELTERGAVVREDQGWLLVDTLPRSEGDTAALEDPSFVPAVGAAWKEAPRGRRPNVRPSELLETLENLRADHARQLRQTTDRLAALRAGRDALVARRARRAAPTPPPAPSS